MTTYATMSGPPITQALPQYEITDADKKRVEKIQAAWKAYEGEFHKPLTKMPDGPDDNVITNRCAQVAEGGINFLFGKEIDFAVEDGAPAASLSLLNKVWGRKEARVPLLQKIAMNGAMSGQAFLRIVPGPKNKFRLIPVDPQIVFVKTAPQDCDTVLLYCLQYCTTEKKDGRDVECYYREEISRVDPASVTADNIEAVEAAGMDDVTWSIAHWTKLGERGNWISSGDPIPWKYPFSPIFSCQNLIKPNDFWGYPDVTQDIIDLNDSINLILSCISRNLKLYSQPILYSNGSTEQELEIIPGKIVTLGAIESKIQAVQIMSDIANALEFLKDLRSDGDERTGVPGIATGRLVDFPRGALSGTAIELMYMSLLSKTNKKRCTYGELIIDVCQALFVLNGMSGDIDVTLSWQNPLPHDDLPSIQGALALQQAGVSKATSLRDLGYDPDAEAALKAEESATSQVMFSRGQGMAPPDQQPDPADPTADQQPELAGVGG